MIVAGDEMGRTQGGNNNAYCQDNEISWLDWREVPENGVLLEFTRRVSDLRANHPVFHRRRYFQGRTFRGSGGLDDIVWLTPVRRRDEPGGLGQRLGPLARRLPERLGDPRLPTRAAIRVQDDSFLLLFNAHFEPVRVHPSRAGVRRGLGDRREHRGAAGDRRRGHRVQAARDPSAVDARSIVVLRRQY